MPIYHKVEPRSQRWHLMRLGRPCSSEFHRIVTPTGKLSAQAEAYRDILLAEAMLGHPIDSVETQWMARGTELEDEAIKAYEFESGNETLAGGIITDDTGAYGCSPDRLVGDDGLLEIKCPAPNTHVGYLNDPSSLPKDKTPQVQGQLLVTGRKWVDLVSYHPELPTVIVRVKPDEKYIAILRRALDEFVVKIASARQNLESKYGAFPDPFAVLEKGEDTLGISDDDVDIMIANGAIEL